MKSRIAVSVLSLSVAILSLALGGCSGGDFDPGSSFSSSAVQFAENSGSSSEGAVPLGEPPIDSTSSTVPQVNDWKDFIGADGQPVTLSEATVDEMGRVTFDYSFIKYAPQIYDDSFKNPDLINWETLEFAPCNDTYTPTVKRLKAGDVLENGLKVTQAVRTLEYGTYIDDATLETRSEWIDYGGVVSFDGELTLSGALYCVPEDGYMTFEGELYFFPDTTSFSQMPVGCDFAQAENEEYTVSESVFPDAKLAVRGGSMYHLGNISETDCDGIIEKGKAAEVTVTIKNIRISSSSGNNGGRGGAFAKIVSIKELPD